MEHVSRGGRSVAGFALGRVGDAPGPAATPILAAVMTGAAAGLLAYTLRAPTWGALLAGSGAMLVTKLAIDRVGA
jgi:hypothetical protein